MVDVENFDARIICAFLKTCQVSNWSMKMMLILVITLCTAELV
jgi:hypothetical protein